MSNAKFRDLPKGFDYVDKFFTPKIRLDKQSRFYINISSQERLGLKPGTTVGIAINYSSLALLIDLRGTKFKVGSRGYITSKEFVRAARLTEKDLPRTYQYNEDESHDDFLIFDLID